MIGKAYNKKKSKNEWMSKGERGKPIAKFIIPTNILSDLSILQ